MNLDGLLGYSFSQGLENRKKRKNRHLGIDALADA